VYIWSWHEIIDNNTTSNSKLKVGASFPSWKRLKRTACKGTTPNTFPLKSAGDAQATTAQNKKL